MNVNEQLLDAICKIADDSVKKAQYDKTIQAQILSCEDATIGKYRCRYQDAIIYAYSNNSDTTFGDGAYVYILVPNGDMSKEKTILGTTKKLGINYISQAQGDEAYNIIGNNCIKIDTNNVYYLDTNNKNYKYKIYEVKEDESENSFFDTTALEQYIRESSSVIVGGMIKTSISPEKQYQGHYGITYNLKFYDSVNNTEVIRSYTIDEDNMVDNPYRLAYKTRQYQIFEIDGPNFIRVQSIQIFNKDFPGANGTITNELLNAGDIEISNLELCGAVRMSENQVNGVAITFYTPQGTFFTKDSKGQSKTITAQVRVKGKLASAAQDIPFYWGSENVGVSASSPYYNKYLGRGWKCLNDSNVIQYQMQHIDSKFVNDTWIIENKQENRYYFRGFEVYIYNSQENSYRLKTKEDEILGNEQNFYYAKPSMVEWIPGTDTYILKFEDATAHDNKFKVAIIYDGVVVTKTINIENLADSPTLFIESSDGTQFYYDIGHPTLTCKVFSSDGIEQDSENYIYNWAYEDNSGTFSELPETVKNNQEYKQAVYLRDEIKYLISIGERFKNESQEDLANAETAVNNFDLIQRIQENKVYNVQIRNITSFGTFKCSVYDKQNENYLGTTSITLTNKLEGENLYSIVINNGAATFQYNQNGIAPNNKTLVAQQQIQALTFTVYDNLGQPIDENIIANDKNCKIRWYFPIKDTLLDDKQEGQNSGTDPTLTYKYYDNRTTLLYGIAQKYDIKKQNNQIRLTVDYKGMNLTTQTQFNFIKQGEPGTNGTEFFVKIVPNTLMNDPPNWPMVTRIGSANPSNYVLNYGIENAESSYSIQSGKDYKFFKAQLWRNGELIWEGTESNPSLQGPDSSKPDYVYWEILSNKYNKNTSDESSFIIKDPLSGEIAIYNESNRRGWDSKNIHNAFANIIKCSITWQNKTYYGTIPITIAWVANNNYRVGLKDNTGFRYVVYSSDGVLPQYDNSHPFEFTCMQNIRLEDGKFSQEDVSNIQGEHKIYYYHYSQNDEDKSLEFYPFSVGTYKTIKDKNLVNTDSNLLEVLTSGTYRNNYNDNQWWARPASRYDGVSINNAICCTFKHKYKDSNGKEFYNEVGKINVPIHFLLNKYGLSNINEWDGNSVQIDDTNGGFILSPQMGAGKKEDGTFTGVLMGTVQFPDKKNPQIGLLGFDRGDRSFFLNSQNGSALFGKMDDGQIIIDPSANKAMIYSGNFWEKYDNETGLPSSYTYRNDKFKPSENAKKNADGTVGAGLLIDLTTPEIYFGSGDFYVNSDGHVHASGGGDIGGWIIDDHSLYSNVPQSNGRITLDAGTYNKENNKVTGPGKIYSHKHYKLDTSDTGFYLSSDGFSIGRKVKIDDDGIMYLGRNAVENGGKPNVEGQPRLSRNYWTINGDDSRSYISYGGDSIAQILTDSTEDVSGEPAKIYIGTDGISLGQRFSVTPQGVLTAYRGTIGGWNINSSTLTAGNITLNSVGSISGGSSYVWQIGQEGSATFNNLTANGTGSIGGWRIASNELSADNLHLYSDGHIVGSNWSIGTDGAASFTNSCSVTNITVNGTGGFGSGGSLSGGGISMGGSSSINPGAVAMAGSAGINSPGSLGAELYKAYKGEFDDLYAKKAQIENLDVMSKLKFHNHSAIWIPVIKSLDGLSFTRTGKTITAKITATQWWAVGSSYNSNGASASGSFTLPDSD